MSGLGQFAFLAPAGLLALLALIVPLLIHLFSRSRGQRVAIANIQLYRHSRQRRVNEVRITQWWLLLLRLLILALAALLLARLVLPGLNDLAGSTAYLSPGWVAQTREGDGGQTRLEQLTEQHEQIYWLTPGFPVWDPAQSLTQGPIKDHWVLLAERLSTINHRGPVHVYSRAGEWGPEAPALPVTPQWHTLAESPGETLPALAVTVVYDPARLADAQLLEAALQALQTHRGGITATIVLQPGGESSAPGTPFDWPEATLSPAVTEIVFWLSPEPPPNRFSRPVTLISDSPASQSAPRVTSRLPHYPALSWRGLLGDTGNKGTVSTPTTTSRVLWRSEQGPPLMLEHQRDGLRHVQLQFPLSRRGNDLLDSGQFPDALMVMMLGSAAWNSTFEPALTGPEQAPRLPGADHTSMPHRDLSQWLALLLAGLWMLERWLSERRHSRTGTALPGGDKAQPLNTGKTGQP